MNDSFFPELFKSFVLPVTKKSSALPGDELEVGVPDGVIIQGRLEVAPVDVDVVDIVEHLRVLLLMARARVRHFDFSNQQQLSLI